MANKKATAPRGSSNGHVAAKDRYEPALSIGWIVLSKKNPRKSFDKDKLSELAQSIKEKGVLEPILVRPLRARQFELVAGERRIRASKLAGRATIPALIKEMTDKEAAEIRLIENVIRDDLQPLEEAAGYRELIDCHGYTVEDLAERVSKSKGYIYGLLKLLALPENGRKAMEEGTLPAATAQLLARVPSEKLRVEATKKVLAGGQEFRSAAEGWVRTAKGAMSYRDAKAYLESVFMVELKKAPFSRVALDLVPSAGACTECSKMTGNDRVAFPDARGDLCTDPECYRAKVQAHAKALAAEKAGEGAKVLSGKAAEKVLGYNSGYLKLSEQCYDDQKYRSYKAILKTALSDGRLPLTVAINERNEVIELVDRGDAEQIMRKDKLIKKRPSMSFRSQPSASQVAARKFYQDLGKELMIAAANAGAGVMNGMDKGWSAAQATFFRQIVKTVIQITWRYGSELQIVLNARTEAELGRGIDAARMEDEKKALSELIDKLNAAQLMGLIAEVLACDLAPVDHHHRGYQDAERNELFASLGVDLEAIKARLQAEAKGKAKTSATGGRK